jgi:hypothetical protein
MIQTSKIDTERAREIWREYQLTHDVSALAGQTAGIDPETGEVFCGADAKDIVTQTALFRSDRIITLRNGEGNDPGASKYSRCSNHLEGEDLPVLKTSDSQPSIQDMKGFPKDVWSGGKQLFWKGGKPGERLELELTATADGKRDIAAVFTMARDFGTVQVYVNDKPLGEALDLYNYRDVIT